MELREYQREAIAMTYKRVAEGHRPIVCAPCGSGKTVIAASMAKDALDRGDRVLWITGREEILRQAFTTFTEVCGRENVGILMRDEKPFWFYPKVTVASWDTIKSRWKKSDIWHIPADVLLVDEAHLSLSRVMLETVMEHYREKTVIGFTATPARKTGKGLGSYYTRIIQVRSVQQIIDDGYLAPCEYWAGSHADVSKAGHDHKTGDFRQRDLSDLHMDRVLVGDVIDNWLRVAKDRHTIVFAVDIAHAQALAERFQEVGVYAESLHSKMSHGLREEISEQFRRGDIQVLVNVGIATYGYDVPSVNCVVLARPTKSIVLHHQMIGRGMRPKGGDYCVVLDHADNCRRLGYVEDQIRWRLAEGSEASVNTTREGDATRDKLPSPPPTECERCHYLFQNSRICPKCGWEKPAAARDVETIQADLVRVAKPKSNGSDESIDRKKWYRMAVGWCIENGKKPGTAFYRYQDKFGTKPPWGWRNESPLKPDARVDAYMRAGLIRYAKRRRREVGQSAAAI